MQKVCILGSDTKIEITVLKRCYPESVGTWEGDWLEASVSIKIPGYSADFLADMRAEEFKEFQDQLISMNIKLEGTASLISIENVVEAKAFMNSLGRIYWEVSTRYPVSTGAILTFDFVSDQSYLGQLIKELEEMLTAFPVKERQASLKSKWTNLFGSRRK